jgi:hypothetical protein
MKKIVLTVVIAAVAVIFGTSGARADAIAIETVSTPSHPGVVMIDFDGAIQTSDHGEYFEDGFRITAGHYHLYDLVDFVDSQYMAIDNFGGSSAMARLDLFGNPFDLLTFEVTSLHMNLGWAGPGEMAFVTSSNGDRAEITETGRMNLPGPPWRHVSWIEFWVVDPNYDFPGCNCGGGGFDTLGFDNMQVRPSPHSVPEPSSLLLLGTGLAAIVARRRVT